MILTYNYSMQNLECSDIIKKLGGGKKLTARLKKLTSELINENKRVISFPLREYWLDVGQIEEYERANQDYHKEF